MFLVSQLLDIAGRLGGPRLRFTIRLRRMERWRTFEHEYFLLDHLVDPNRAAVDVGANEGLYAGRMAQLCRRVHCFEPLPWMAADLRAKLPRRVEVHEAAVSDSEGQAELRIPYSGNVQMHGTATIEVGNTLDGATRIEVVRCPRVTLDTAVTEPVGFLKIDVEGHEMAVLRGAAGLIARDRPVLLVESEKRHAPEAPECVFGFLRGLGYEGVYFADGLPRALRGFRSDIHQSAANIDGVRKIGTYVNNFLFIPS